MTRNRSSRIGSLMKRLPMQIFALLKSPDYHSERTHCNLGPGISMVSRSPLSFIFIFHTFSILYT